MTSENVPGLRVFLAGGAGVLGRRVIPLLTAAGHTVVATTRSPRRTGLLRDLEAEPVRVDAHDAGALAAAVRAAAPDVVLHQLTDLAGGDLAANARLREQGTRNLVAAALAAGVRRIVAQSICWTYVPGDGPAAESVPLDLGATEPRRTTVAGVAALEAAARELPEWVVLRYGMLYGPGTWFAPDGLRAAQAREGALRAGADVTSFVHVDDAATAAVTALGWPSGAVNVCDDEPAPAREWLPAFCRAVGAPPPPASDAPRDPAARGADNRHARRELGWRPAYPSWREGFATLAIDRDIPDNGHSRQFINGRVENSGDGHDEPMPAPGKVR
ncbi:NAD(P)-dependent oxidoreductase [Actinomadura sp. ATCC 31491]|uniref:NAD(P)-dependent oxidoreductase n=1 Tax=Actinomadura luzonensis TaxID=2805427 RepID=A0ABT0GAX7_9ACTN|nr:NAD(P)-dependent oxidoreductase [Actinomadura luzonensis]MCK2221248.1 NAD(P)-dependent oxidoreductase [Actinomadura luzonensis]